MKHDLLMKEKDDHCAFVHTGDNHWEVCEAIASAKFLNRALIAFIQKMRPHTLYISMHNITEHPIAFNADFESSFPGYFVKNFPSYISIESSKMLKVINSMTN